jgi:hypothetical protein
LTATALFGDGHRGYNGWSDGKLALDRKLPAMPPFVIHDLRHSVPSGMARLGINLPVIECVLNHVSGSFAGIVGVSEEKREALEKRAASEGGSCADRPVSRGPFSATAAAAVAVRESR